MLDPKPTQSFLATFLATAQGKLISVLAVVALLVTILTEVISAVNGYHSMRKTRAEADALTDTMPTFNSTDFQRYQEYRRDHGQ
jgi:ABC-type siderophore export system fused ATPase/permease subunit